MNVCIECGIKYKFWNIPNRYGMIEKCSRCNEKFKQNVINAIDFFNSTYKTNARKYKRSNEKVDKYPYKVRKKREIALRNATPEWLTEEHKDQIRELYRDAQDLRWLNEESLHIDHIIPLQGKNVSGLHVPWNLQILTSSKNLEKSNHYAQ